MEIVQRTILKIFTSFYILTAMLSLVTAAPTPIASTPAAITTSPVGNATMLTLNQSLCPDPETDITAARDSLCHGHLLANGVIENALKNVTGHCSNDSLSITQVVTNVQSILCGADFSRTSPLLFPSGQCSNDSSSAVTDIRNVICGTTSSDRELHVKASVLLTYHSMTSQAATATDTDEGIRMHMQNISEMLRGLLRNYFRVIPNHCSCNNTSSCVTILDLTEKLNLSHLISNCSLTAYISQHLLGDHRLISEGYRDLRPSPCHTLHRYPIECPRWIDEYIRPYSSDYSPIC